MLPWKRNDSLLAHEFWLLLRKLGATTWKSSCLLLLPGLLKANSWVVSTSHKYWRTHKHTTLQVFGMLFDGLLEKNEWSVLRWRPANPSTSLLYKSYLSFVQEQKQLQMISTKSRRDVGSFQSFCSSQAGFRVRRHLSKSMYCFQSCRNSFNITGNLFVFCFSSISLAARTPLNGTSFQTRGLLCFAEQQSSLTASPAGPSIIHGVR